MKIGFIGLGNMATAMIGGMLQKAIAAPEDIIGSSKTLTTAEKVKTKFNINATTDNKTVAEQSDILFLSVKPIFFHFRGQTGLRIHRPVFWAFRQPPPHPP